MPKSICPLLKNAKSNIVRLSAQEHFLAHYHIWKAFRDELYEKAWARKMCCAFTMMKRQLIRTNNIELLSRLYDEARKQLSEDMKNRVVTENTKKKLSMQRTGKGNPFVGCHHSIGTKTKIKKALTGKARSKEHCMNLSKANIGKHQSEETKHKIGNFGRGKHWFNNGTINIFAKECPEGFVAGMLKRQK